MGELYISNDCSHYTLTYKVYWRSCKYEMCIPPRSYVAAVELMNKNETDIFPIPYSEWFEVQSQYNTIAVWISHSVWAVENVEFETEKMKGVYRNVFAMNKFVMRRGPVQSCQSLHIDWCVHCKSELMNKYV